MAGQKTRFEDTCEITGIKNEISVLGEILQFREKDVIIATIHRAANNPNAAQTPLPRMFRKLKSKSENNGPKSTTG